MTHPFDGNRVVQDTGCRVPILNAPVGSFARAQLAGAVSAAGGMRPMETSSAGLEETAAQFDLARAHTDAPLGSQMFMRVLKEHGGVMVGCGFVSLTSGTRPPRTVSITVT